MKIFFYISILFFLVSGSIFAQNLQSIQFSAEKGLKISHVLTAQNDILKLANPLPLFSFQSNNCLLFSDQADIKKFNDRHFALEWGKEIRSEIEVVKHSSPGTLLYLTIRNVGQDTIVVNNVVPFGQKDDRTYITGSGPWSLARSKLFRPGKGPVGVILPDNAWEMGYASYPVDEDWSLVAIARRKEIKQGKKRRYDTHLYPGGEVTYYIYINRFRGAWQNGLKMMFQERYLYDLDTFDNSMFEREDLKWIRHEYTMALQFAWDHEFYDAQNGGYKVAEYLDMGKRLFGGWDVFGLWPTWPTLGIDQRNQWDLYKDLPGGLDQIKKMSGIMQSEGTKFFIAYNPWDKSTRQVDPYRGMADLIRNINANGVILDTRGSSSYELQKAADNVKAGVVMYSEGMAVPKDMPGIVSGRVHDAIFLPPPLNLNKLIKPDFAIFRVCQLSQGRLHREFAISFFNGYGIEMNVFAPGRPDWMEEEYLYWGKLVKILRENSAAFLSQNWTPLVPTIKDSVWVNKWPVQNKTLYTVYSLLAEGFNGPLFEASSNADSHYVSLYHNEEIHPDTINGKTYVSAKTNSFDKSWLRTRREGNVDCIAQFPNLLQVTLEEDSLFFDASAGEKILLWAGEPSYQNKELEFSVRENRVKLSDLFDRYQGKHVVQLMGDNELLDERVIYVKPGSPQLISRVIRTKAVSEQPGGMVKVTGGKYIFKVRKKESFIPYPDYSAGKEVKVKSFYMDKYPVTNGQFQQFLEATGYLPKDTTRFLKNWQDGMYPLGMAEHPVVYISLEDARAYADWAGKRLPTEIEWQYAAQGNDGRLWPWGNEFDSTRCNVGFNELTRVDIHPEGRSPFGVMDIVGNIWQLTNDIYDNGSHYFIIIRGGSYYHPTSSWWYVHGGPQPLDKSQMLLRVSPGFERNATVGFRCVKDTE